MSLGSSLASEGICLFVGSLPSLTSGLRLASLTMAEAAKKKKKKKKSVRERAHQCRLVSNREEMQDQRTGITRHTRAGENILMDAYI